MPPVTKGSQRRRVRNGRAGGGAVSSGVDSSTSGSSRPSRRRSRALRRARRTDQSRTAPVRASASTSRTSSRSRIGRSPVRAGLLEQVHRDGDVLVAELVRQAGDDAGGGVLAEDAPPLAPAPLEAEQLLGQRR